MEALGIGCLWFARRNSAIALDGDDTSPSEHLKDIREALEDVDNVSEVEVFGDGGTYAGIAGLDDDDDEQNFYPIYSGVIVSFNIFMPKRLQEKYAYGRTTDGAESFHVKVVYDGIMPVAYIHYSTKIKRSDVHRHSPSSAVIFIRKYLAEKLDGHPKIDFQILGPSPFHADLFLDAATPQDVAGTALDVTELGAGYRTLLFFTESTSADEQVEEIVSDYQTTLKSFYAIIRMNNYSSNLKSAVLEGASGLLRPISATSPWGRFNHWRAYRARIDDVFHSLLAEKMNRVANARFLAELHENEEINKGDVFYRFIERETKTEAPLLDEDIRELLVMLEERRRGYFENSATLFSGLAGGILGAALGASLSVMLSTQPTEKPPLKSESQTQAAPARPELRQNQ